MALAAWVAGALLAAVGVGLGALVRSQLTAVVGVFVWSIVISPSEPSSASKPASAAQRPRRTDTHGVRAGSGDKQAKAKLRRVEIEEVAVAFGPPA